MMISACVITKNEEKNIVQKQNYLKQAEKYLTETIENAYDNDDIINSIEFNKSLSKSFMDLSSLFFKEYKAKRKH